MFWAELNDFVDSGVSGISLNLVSGIQTRKALVPEIQRVRAALSCQGLPLSQARQWKMPNARNPCSESVQNKADPGHRDRVGERRKLLLTFETLTDRLGAISANGSMDLLGFVLRGLPHADFPHNFRPGIVSC